MTKAASSDEDKVQSNSQFCCHPSQIYLDSISHQYPVTLARRLFSSVPRREYALNDIHLRFQEEVVFLTGASSSGKSTILKLIDGQEQPTQGKVSILMNNDKHCSGIKIALAKPVYLDFKPPFENRRTLRRVVNEQLDQLTQNGKIRLILDQQLIPYLACNVFQIGSKNNQQRQTFKEFWDTKTPADLSTSEQYRFQLLLSSIESMLANQNYNDDEDVAVQESTKNTCILHLPSPILLLDEWLDREASVVVQSVQQSLELLTNDFHAISCIVTHKQERWNLTNTKSNTIRQITLSGGKIVKNTLH